jgi:hypothetical protein
LLLLLLLPARPCCRWDGPSRQAHLLLLLLLLLRAVLLVGWRVLLLLLPR